MTEALGDNAQKQLQAIVFRIERLEEEKAETAMLIKDVYLEAKSNGYDPKVIRALLKERKIEENVRIQMGEMLDVYRHAVNGKSSSGGDES